MDFAINNSPVLKARADDLIRSFFQRAEKFFEGPVFDNVHIHNPQNFIPRTQNEVIQTIFLFVQCWALAKAVRGA
ncbi:MAG TPA: hypothetical protein DD648_05065 [Candidatus Omnitrophica bacterium]|nr:hypothetical protein [Candidatus Omnitrophota bacterium]